MVESAKIYSYSEAASHSTASKPDSAFSGVALLLEDDDFDAAVTRELLEKVCATKYRVKRAKVLSQAVQMLGREDFTIAFVDMNMPDSQGLDTVREVIRANPHIPIVVLTGNDDTETASEALKLGAQDYIPKSELDSRTLQRVAQYSIQRKLKETELTMKAYYDNLTGLANRALLYERWRRSLARATRTSGYSGVLIADLNRFKQVNDRFGHDAGDALLKDFAERLTAAVRETDVVARLGGDEFVIVLENIHSGEELESIIAKLSGQQPYTFGHEGRELAYTASIGGAVSDPAHDEDLMAVIKRADKKMYERKAEARVSNAQGSSTSDR